MLKAETYVVAYEKKKMIETGLTGLTGGILRFGN
jgi:hypothetical protein